MKSATMAKLIASFDSPHSAPKAVPNRSPARLSVVRQELLPGVIGNAPSLRALASLVRKLATTSLPVLVLGESGTGKELVARALHACGPRADQPFVAINAASLTSQLGLSALFGHEAGAFTGASRNRPGAFREAHGGTLFIDELGALPLEAQAILLRVTEDRLVTPIGADRGTLVDVRLVTASCEPLYKRMQLGTFRSDLFERLATAVVHVPALRKRPDDVPLLARHLLETSELAGVSLSADACRSLQRYDFPGNVRELRNILMQAALHGDGPIICETVIETVLAARRPVRMPKLSPELAHALLHSKKGNISKAARCAGLARSTFRDLLKRAELPPPREQRPANSTATSTRPAAELARSSPRSPNRLLRD